MANSKEYVVAHAARTTRPRRNLKRWYRCACGLWWGVNKRFNCMCDRPPPSRHNPKETP